MLHIFSTESSDITSICVDTSSIIMKSGGEGERSNSGGVGERSNRRFSSAALSPRSSNCVICGSRSKLGRLTRPGGVGVRDCCGNIKFINKVKEHATEVNNFLLLQQEVSELLILLPLSGTNRDMQCYELHYSSTGSQLTNHQIRHKAPNRQSVW